MVGKRPTARDGWTHSVGGGDGATGPTTAVVGGRGVDCEAGASAGGGPIIPRIGDGAAPRGGGDNDGKSGSN